MPTVPNGVSNHTQSNDRGELELRLSWINWRTVAEGVGLTGVEAEARFIKGVSAALTRYIDSLGQSSFPRRKEERDSLDQFRSRAALLLNSLDQLDDTTRELLAWELSRDPARDRTRAAEKAIHRGQSENDTELAAFRHDLRRICGAAYRLLEESPAARRKTRADDSFAGFVADLARIYNANASSSDSPRPGRKPARWTFDEFVTHLHAAFLPEADRDFSHPDEVVA